jgi:glycosyltransferase involved in cell wall biosynthesis
VPAHQPGALADAILCMAENPDLRMRLGRNGRARAVAQFSLDSCVASYVRLYRGAAAIPSRSVAAIIAGK